MTEKIDIHWQQLAPRVGLSGVASNIDINISANRIGKGGQFILQLLGGEHGRRNAAQAASIVDSSRQTVVLRSSHGGLNQSKRVGVQK